MMLSAVSLLRSLNASDRPGGAVSCRGATIVSCSVIATPLFWVVFQEYHLQFACADLRRYRQVGGSAQAHGECRNQNGGGSESRKRQKHPRYRVDSYARAGRLVRKPGEVSDHFICIDNTAGYVVYVPLGVCHHKMDEMRPGDPDAAPN